MKKYKLNEKKVPGGYIALTSSSFACIIKRGEEVILSREQFLKMRNYVLEVKEKPKEKAGVVKSLRKKRVSGIDINGDV